MTQQYNQDMTFGIPFKEHWTIARVRAYTKLNCGFWIDDVYNYDVMNKEVIKRTSSYNLQLQKCDGQELDQYMWEEWTKVFEESRQFVQQSFIDFGISEAEAHFLSIRYAKSVISKFRLKMFIDFGGQDGKEEFQRTALRNAINYLYIRFDLMTVRAHYVWSVKAVDEKVSQFRKEAAVETAKLLVEETGAILHAKLVL